MSTYHFEWAARQGPRRLVWRGDDFHAFNDDVAMGTARYLGADHHDHMAGRWPDIVIGWQLYEVTPVGSFRRVAEGKN